MNWRQVERELVDISRRQGKSVRCLYDMDMHVVVKARWSERSVLNLSAMARELADALAREPV